MALNEYEIVDGQLFQVVRQHQNVELAQLEAEVASNEEQVASAQQAADEANARLAELQGQLEDSKSNHATASGLVGSVVETPAEGVDGGTNDSGSEVPNPTEEPGNDTAGVDTAGVDGVSVTF